MQSSLSKKLTIPVMTFLSMIVLNITNIISGVQDHKTWKIVVAAIALAVTIAALIILWIKVSQINKQRSS
ncbi:hypothetical protein IM792_12540 [Mucilaginibacter sp. JRF]|uniref:hypothetical protein n=1 Tax=Mucilaginibacter sp. JRF TaxID=2780088 RepID=UPI001881E5FB|nr:hypothetical protein [Mucilaginibacter sp. JRF]MBE9585280.1 hypothetical protein [Mucilaginibacter sp. JRF]